MFKLVVIGGKLRGKEFILNDGDNIAGRDESVSNVHIPLDGISKKHFSITVTGDTAYIKDLGSANGTILNGTLIRQGTIKSGDRIVLPDLILQIVYVKEKKIIVKKQMVDSEASRLPQDFFTPPPPPIHSLGKLKHFFKYKVMGIFYGINQEHEWSIMLGVAMALFAFITISLTIFPVLNESRKLLEEETIDRGWHFVNEISRTNSKALSARTYDQVDTTFLDNAPGVKNYELFDVEGRIIRPLTRINDYVNDSFSVEALEMLVENISKNKDNIELGLHRTSWLSGEINLAETIKAYNLKTGALEPVGLIVVRFSPKSLFVKTVKNMTAYLQSLVVSGVVAIFFFGLIYYLTTRPLEEFHFQIEEVLHGKRKTVSPELCMEELKPLETTVNAVLQRNRELQSTEADGIIEMEEDTSYVSTLLEFLKGTPGPSMVLNSEKNLQKINTQAEDITGIRDSSAQGLPLLDVCREKGFAALLIELCENCANNAGTSQEGVYDLSGKDYNIYVTGLVGRDKFVKAYYITFVLVG